MLLDHVQSNCCKLMVTVTARSPTEKITANSSNDTASDVAHHHAHPTVATVTIIGGRQTPNAPTIAQTTSDSPWKHKQKR